MGTDQLHSDDTLQLHQSFQEVVGVGWLERRREAANDVPPTDSWPLHHEAQNSPEHTVHHAPVECPIEAYPGPDCYVNPYMIRAVG